MFRKKKTIGVIFFVFERWLLQWQHQICCQFWWQKLWVCMVLYDVLYKLVGGILLFLLLEETTSTIVVLCNVQCITSKKGNLFSLMYNNYIQSKKHYYTKSHFSRVQSSIFLLFVQLQNTICLHTPTFQQDKAKLHYYNCRNVSLNNLVQFQ